MKRHVGRAAIATALLVIAAVAVLYRLFPADRSTAPLDRAPEQLIVPEYFDPVFFLGQGFPVHRQHVLEGERLVGDTRVYVLPHVATALDYKNVQETSSQVEKVNALYSPSPPWRYRPERRLGHYKCMSTSASTLLDWQLLQREQLLPSYESILDEKHYRGVDPRSLDSLYYEAAQRDPDRFALTDSDHLDPVSSTPVPFSLAGFAALIERLSADRQSVLVQDAQLPLRHPLDLSALQPLRAIQVLEPELDWRVIFRFYPKQRSQALREALQQYGPLLAGVKIRFSALHGVFRDTRLGDLPILGASGHGVLIVGVIERADRLYFLYRETFGPCDEEQADCGPAYRIYPVYSFHEAYAFASAVKSPATNVGTSRTSRTR